MTVGELKKLLDAYPEEWLVLTDAYEGGQDVPELFQVACIQEHAQRQPYIGRWIVEDTTEELKERIAEEDLNVDEDYCLGDGRPIQPALLISCRYYR